MSISVSNTNASLSTKTITVNENADTVTGLKTFDRDPAAPFAVTSGSAVVTNLDADKLDGQEGSYYLDAANTTNLSALPVVRTTYSPTLSNLTIGNGTVSAGYTQLGKLVFYDCKITLGSTSSVTGGIQFSLPVTASDGKFVAVKAHGYAFDTSGGAYTTMAAADSGNGTNVFPTTSGAAQSGTSSTIPFTWATGDMLIMAGWFYAA